MSQNQCRPYEPSVSLTWQTKCCFSWKTTTCTAYCISRYYDAVRCSKFMLSKNLLVLVMLLMQACCTCTMSGRNAGDCRGVLTFMQYASQAVSHNHMVLLAVSRSSHLSYSCSQAVLQHHCFCHCSCPHSCRCLVPSVHLPSCSHQSMNANYISAHDYSIFCNTGWDSSATGLACSDGKPIIASALCSTQVSRLGLDQQPLSEALHSVR